MESRQLFGAYDTSACSIQSYLKGLVATDPCIDDLAESLTYIAYTV
jgi:hypothetical protein